MMYMSQLEANKKPPGREIGKAQLPVVLVKIHIPLEKSPPNLGEGCAIYVSDGIQMFIILNVPNVPNVQAG